MDNLLYIIAIILVIVWAIGFFVYATSAIIHILLFVAAIPILLSMTQENKVIK